MKIEKPLMESKPFFGKVYMTTIPRLQEPPKYLVQNWQFQHRRHYPYNIVQSEHFCYMKLVDPGGTCPATGMLCSQYPKCMFVAWTWVYMGFTGLVRRIQEALKA